MSDQPFDLPRTLFAILFIGSLLVGSFLVLRPFLPAIIWATMVVVATWPLMRSIQDRLNGSRAAAVSVMTIALLLVLFVPLTMAIVTLLTHTDQLVSIAKSAQSFLLSPPPEWIKRLPIVGDTLLRFWSEYAFSGLQGLASRAAPYADDLGRWFAARMGGVGMVLLQFLLTVVLAALLFSKGEQAAEAVLRFARRLGGDHGAGVVRLSAQAIRSVALGVGVTAIVQTLISGIGMALCGVPFSGMLTALAFMLCIAQIGPILVLAPAVGWLFWSDHTAAGAVLLAITIFVGSIDNVLRPILIRRGADLPLLLILGGVIGGLIAFGMVGIFLGPLVLAISYTLLGAWIDAETAAAAPLLTETAPASTQVAE